MLEPIELLNRAAISCHRGSNSNLNGDSVTEIVEVLACEQELPKYSQPTPKQLNTDIDIVMDENLNKESDQKDKKTTDDPVLVSGEKGSPIESSPDPLKDASSLAQTLAA